MAIILLIACAVLGFFVTASRGSEEDNPSPVVVIQTEHRASAGQLWRMFMLGFLAALFLLVVLWTTTNN